MTASFSHRDAGTAPSDWSAAAWVADAAELGLPPAHTRIVVVAAHADDETLGVGGLIVAASRAGGDVVVIVASDGAASHPASSAITPAQLTERRRDEVIEAVRILSPAARLVQLGLPDGRLGDHVPPIADAVRAALPAGPAWVVTTAADDRHPDHAACATAVRSAVEQRPDVRVYEYPIWWWHWADPAAVDEGRRIQARRFPLTPADRERKSEALAQYRSQLDPVGPAAADEPVLGPSFLRHFERDFELVFDVRPRPPTDPEYFGRLYAAAADPWCIGARWYEARKRAVALASLPRATFRRAFEPGCANGDLSADLALRCTELICTDVAAEPIRATAARLDHHPNARVVRGAIPEDWPPGEFDLVVLSEVGYYCPDLGALADRVDACLAADGVVLLVHWRWPAADYPHTAETVHATIRHRCRLHVLAEHVERDFLLHVLTRADRSVAQVESIVE